jgi:hypothetical protein
MQICVAVRYNSEYIHGTAQPSARPLDNCFSFFLLLLLFLEREEKKKWHFSINRATDKRFSAVVVVVVVVMIVVVKGKKEKEKHTLQPSQVKAPKWKPAAGSPHTLHSWFICKKAQKRERDR